MTQATLAARSVDVWVPHNWTLVNGTTTLWTRGTALLTGNSVGARQWEPSFQWDNATLASDACRLSFNLPAGQTSQHAYPFDMECQLASFTTGGRHTVRIQNNAAGTAPTIDATFTFVLVQRAHIEFTQPDVHDEVAAVDGNVTLVNGTINEHQEWSELNSLTYGTHLGTTSTLNILVILAIAVVGTYIWRSPDRDRNKEFAERLFLRLVGGVIVLVSFLISLEFMNTWTHGVSLSLILGVLAGALAVMGTTRELYAVKETRKSSDSLDL